MFLENDVEFLPSNEESEFINFVNASFVSFGEFILPLWDFNTDTDVSSSTNLPPLEKKMSCHCCRFSKFRNNRKWEG